jgi:hypothetical protein
MKEHQKAKRDRRDFLKQGTLASAALLAASHVSLSQTDSAPATPPAEFKHKIKLGVVGNGGRGSWIAKLFQKHGGYQMHAVADYFQEVADQCGDGVRNDPDGVLVCRAYGGKANAQINYWGKAFVRGGKLHYPGGTVENLYEAGAIRNIATFYRDVTQGKFENSTVARSVDCVLNCVLGREAATRRLRLTMEQLLKENRKMEVNLKGLKA